VSAAVAYGLEEVTSMQQAMYLRLVTSRKRCCADVILAMQ
jgi:hypothetical protein